MLGNALWQFNYVANFAEKLAILATATQQAVKLLGEERLRFAEAAAMKHINVEATKLGETFDQLDTQERAIFAQEHQALLEQYSDDVVRWIEESLVDGEHLSAMEPVTDVYYKEELILAKCV